MWLYCYIHKKRLATLFNNMATHIHSCPLEPSLKFKKLEKINKIAGYLTILDSVPLYAQKAGIILLYMKWKLIVKENGYMSIDNTLKHLDMGNIITVNGKLNDNKNNFSTFNAKEFLTHFKDIILPLNCQIRYIDNKNPIIDCCKVRPALPCIEGKLFGLCVNFEQPKFTLKIFGLISNDPVRYYRNKINKSIIIDDIQKRYAIPHDEIIPYLNAISLRDFVVYEYRQISNKIKQNREKINYYKTADMSIIFAEYQFLADDEKIEYLNMMLQLGLVEQCKLLVSSQVNLKYLDWECQKKLAPGTFTHNAQKSMTHASNDAPYEIKIASMNVSDKIKTKAYDKLKVISKSQDGAPKEQKYLDGILRIPFGQIRNESAVNDDSKTMISDFIKKYPSVAASAANNRGNTIIEYAIENNIGTEMAKTIHKKLLDSKEKQQSYLKKVHDILDKCVHGHKLVKTQINRLLAKWISGGQSGMVIGIQGPPGNGKTTLIKHGLAKCLVDQHGRSRPVGFIPLAGSTGASSLVGHSYTYQGSNWGRIVDILIDSECMNPILMFDELDKISKSEHGNEIAGILTHLTDSTQNDEFFDKYFDGVPLDLSKAIMIFTFNDQSAIDPILLDRMTVIKTDPLNIDDKLVIARKHLIPPLLNAIDLLPSELNITDDIIENIIVDYTKEAGARQLKRILDDLIQELNLRRLVDPEYCLKIDEDLVGDVLSHVDKIRKESISDTPIIGQINGMYANVLALGGILPIQVSSCNSDNKLELTGTQGDVMKESMKCAKTMAFTMIEKFADLKSKDTYDKIGLHIHCPATSMPKDGPSAGGAICLAIYSFITKKPIQPNIAMTGEIDLYGNITAIGGLDAKLNGAKKAGINVALIPKENHPQLQRIRDEGHSPEDDYFEVIEIPHIYDALPYCFLP